MAELEIGSRRIQAGEIFANPGANLLLTNKVARVQPDAMIVIHIARHGTEHGPGAVIGYFRDYTAATNAAKDKGWYGGNGTVHQGSAIRFQDKVYLLAHETPIDLDGEQARADEALRQLTLNGLTHDQKRVLGLLPEQKK